MKRVLKAGVLVCAGAMLFSCGGGSKDKEGKPLAVGQEYLMTRQGLEPVPFPKDKSGNKLEPGREYLMGPNGLEPVPYLKDREGKKVELGNEYIMTEEGLRLVQSRSITGTVQDNGGRPLQGVTVSLDKSAYSAVTGADGTFKLPFVEGYAKLVVSAPNVPQWCQAEPLENVFLNRESYPAGWNLGVVKLPCVWIGSKNGKTSWASANGLVVDNGDGTVTDTKSGLMWEAAVTEQGIPWNRAAEHCQGLDLGGYSDWRLPTVEELNGLYEANVACSWHGPAMIRDASSVWTSERQDDASARVFNACTGKVRESRGLDEGPGANPGVLAVRGVGK